MRRLLGVLLFLGLVATGWSQDSLDSDFYECAKQMRLNTPIRGVYKEGVFHGYINAVEQTLVMLGMIKLPDGTTNRTITEVVSKYIVDHPNEWAGGRFMLVFNALMQAFPVPKETKTDSGH